jgi:hypothetical protein
MSLSVPAGVSTQSISMNLYFISHISAFSILLPLAVAIVKQKSIGRKYFLLVVLLVIGGINDVASYVIIKAKGANTFNDNIYQLIEFIFLVLLFKKWPSERRSRFHIIILITGITAWIIDNGIFHTPFDNTSVYRLICAILVLFVCIDQVNFVLLNRHTSIFTSELLICGGLILYHLFAAFIESFQLFAVQIQRPFYMWLWVIHCLLSILTNLLIAIAFLCHRSKPNYTILSSPHSQC